MRRLLHAAAVACLCGVAISRGAEGALPQTQAWRVRVASNGHGVVVVDAQKGGAVDWWVRPYAMQGPGEATVDVLHDAYFGVRVNGGKGVWAKDLPLTSPVSTCVPGAPACQPGASFAYVPLTRVVAEQRTVAGVELVSHIAAPGEMPGPSIMLVASLSAPVTATVEVALLANFHVGAGAPQPAIANEQVVALSAKDAFESSPASPHRVLLRALPPTVGDQSAPPSAIEVVNPYAKWTNGQAFGGALDSGPGEDRVIGVQWAPVKVVPGQKLWFGAIAIYGAAASSNALQAAADAWNGGNGTAYMAVGNAVTSALMSPPQQLPPEIANTPAAPMFAQCARLLAAAQSRTPNFGPPHSNQTPFGQIPASLPPGQWHITWPRDQAYAGVALTVAGLHEQARWALDFILNGKTGGFVDKVGAPYLVSPTRYYGGGLEEVDVNENGPNVELDGFGLVLWQAGRYVDATDDAAWLAKAWPQLRDGAAAVLVKAVDDTGLVKPDSSIWEVHWNGQQKHFTYTSTMAVRGLCSAAKLATRMGQGAVAAQYREVAQGIRDAILTKLVKADGVLRGNLEEAPDKAYDAAVVEAFLDGQIDAAGPIAQATWQALVSKLSAGGGPGFIRNDDGGAYDSAEWLFIDLRMLRWLQKMAAAGVAGASDDAKLLRARVLAIAAAGGGLVPELIATTGPNAGQFAGAVPMLGFGAGAMVLALAGSAADDDLAACLAGSQVVQSDAVEEAELVEAVVPEFLGEVEVAVEAVTVDAVPDGKPMAQPAQRQAQDDGCASGGGRSGLGAVLVLVLAACCVVGRLRSV